MRILYAASEANPFAKSGGLADVAGALPKALVKDGVDARVIMPLYLGIALEIVAHNLHLFRFTPRFVVFVLLQQLIHINHPLIYLNNSLYCPKVIGLLLLMIVPCIMQIFSYNIQCSLVIKRIITKMLQNINVFTFHHQLLS